MELALEGEVVGHGLLLEGQNMRLWEVEIYMFYYQTYLTPIFYLLAFCDYLMEFFKGSNSISNRLKIILLLYLITNCVFSLNALIITIKLATFTKLSQMPSSLIYPIGLIPLITLLLTLTSPQQLYNQSYRVNVTYDQIIYWRRSLPYIQQQTGKRCTKASPMAQQRFCKKRCELMFYYIPDAPYKNYRFYNKTTKDCQPKVICPKIFTVKYNTTANICYDMSTGDIVPGVNATPYVGNDTYEVEFVCVHGKVGTYKGRKECICDFGWRTEYVTGVRTNPKYQKCNTGISIFDYLPTSLQIYYDPLIDLEYPHPADPQYWSKILINYVRQLKYSLLEIIWPTEVQLTLLAVPEDDFISSNEYKYLFWGGLILGMVVLITIYEKVKNTRTVDEIVVEKEQVQE